MPPAYEILLLNTAIPQIQAAQSGDTYVVPRDIAFSTVASFAAGAEATPSIVATGDTDTGIWFPAADTVAISTGGISRLRLNSSGNLGLGVTPSTGDIYYRKFELGKVGCGLTAATTSLTSSELTYLTGNAYARYTGGNPWVYGNDGAAAIYGIEDGTHSWYNAPSGTANTTTITNGVSYTIITSGNQTAFGAANNNVGTVFTATSSGTLSSGTVSQNISFTQAMTLDASGNLLVGGTTNTSMATVQITVGSTSTASSALQLLSTTSGSNGIYFGDGTSSTDRYRGYFEYNHASDFMVFATAATERARISSDGTFRVKGAGTAGSTDAVQFSGSAPASTLILDSSGNLLLGTTTTVNKLTVFGTSNQFASITSLTGGSTQVGINLNPSLTASEAAANPAQASIYAVDSNYSANIIFANKATGAVGNALTERARITSGGYFKASNDGNYSGISNTYHEFYQTANSPSLLVRATNGSYTSSVLEVNGDRSTTNATYNLINAYNGPISGQFIVRDSGNVVNTNNSYGAISDVKMKVDIVDAGSQWSDIKAIRFRKFKMKSDPKQVVQLGVVAQELEQTSPGLVEEHADRDGEGNDLGTTTKSVKTSVLLMKAAVALQEAMARIEKLEAEVAALKGA